MILTGFCRYGYSPDFSLQNSAELYLLRQGAAYGLEYFLLYRVALNALLCSSFKTYVGRPFFCGIIIDAPVKAACINGNGNGQNARRAGCLAQKETKKDETVKRQWTKKI